DALAFCYTKFHCWIDPTNRSGALPIPRAHPERCRNCRSHFWLFPVRNRLIQTYLKHFVRTPVAVSQALADALTVNGLRIHRVIHNGIPAEDFASIGESATVINERWGLGEGPTFLAGGRLSHFKGHEQALRAFQRGTSNVSRAQLLIMGGYGWYGEYLATRAKDLGISDRVRFLGQVPREDVPAVISRSSAVLNLSMYLDPFPTMNLEAMAASRAVVGTCFGGTPEAVEHGRTGYVVNPYDEAAVAERLRDLSDGPDLASQLGAAGLIRLRERFQISQMVDAYEAIYREALD
ncbi:MAG: glycosyltransferase family 4 protein, partial [Chloroflexota bacterium]